MFRNSSSENDTTGRQMGRGLRKTVYVVPSLLTTANIFCGFYSVMESLQAVQKLALENVDAASDHFDRAALNIGVAVLFDFLDGRIARMTGATTQFGIELDSIADVVSFGIAPAVLSFAWGYGQFPQLHKMAWAVSFLFLVCGALRLARFNVQASSPGQPHPPKSPKVDRKAFVGMPIPAGASLIAAIVHFSPMPLAEAKGFAFTVLGANLAITGIYYGVALLILVAFLAFLMVSTVRYTSFKNIGGARNYHPRVFILLLAVFVLAIWFYSEWSLLILATLYSSHGVVGKLWSLVRPRRTAVDQQELELDPGEG